MDDEYEHWDLNWTDLSVSEHRVSKMLPFQRVNHFQGMMEICRKAALSRHLKRMRSACPAGTYDFAPETWEHPNEMEAFRKHCKAHPGGSYIVKPTAGAMGRGIYLVKGPDAIDHKHESAVVVQKYVSSPFLVDGFKFDLRIYALVTCVDPLTVYVYEEGIARFATTRYQKPTASNLASKTMHLTNYSLNKHSADFVHTETDDEGTKRALSALWKDLRAKGHDVDALWREIRDLVVKTVAPIQPLLAHAYHSATKSNRKPRDAFGGDAETREVFGARHIGGSVRNARVGDSYATSYASRFDSSSSAEKKKLAALGVSPRRRRVRRRRRRVSLFRDSRLRRASGRSPASALDRGEPLALVRDGLAPGPASQDRLDRGRAARAGGGPGGARGVGRRGEAAAETQTVRDVLRAELFEQRLFFCERRQAGGTRRKKRFRFRARSSLRRRARVAARSRLDPG